MTVHIERWFRAALGGWDSELITEAGGIVRVDCMGVEILVAEIADGRFAMQAVQFRYAGTGGRGSTRVYPDFAVTCEEPALHRHQARDATEPDFPCRSSVAVNHNL